MYEARYWILSRTLDQTTSEKVSARLRVMQEGGSGVEFRNKLGGFHYGLESEEIINAKNKGLILYRNFI